MSKNRTISISQDAITRLQLDSDEIVELFHFLDEHGEYVIPEGELSIAFVDDQTQCQLHADFLDDPSSTDVITFPGDPLMDFAGEICVNAERALLVAPDHGQTFNQELTLYLVHGWLHLAGLDDHCDEDIAQMRAGETLLMAAVTDAGVLPKFEMDI